MTDRRFYGTNNLVDEQVKSLEEIEVLDGGWTKKYVDPNGNHWLQYNVDPDRGYHYNLMRITPVLTTNDLIQIALFSEYNDEVSAASLRLYLEEQQEGKEYREELLDAVKSTYTNNFINVKSRVDTIIRASQLLDSTNRRNILNKHVSEIESDYQYFKTSSQKAKAILLEMGLPVDVDQKTMAYSESPVIKKPFSNLQLLWNYFKVFLMILGTITLVSFFYWFLTDFETFSLFG